jgi:hypothetical protein
MGTHVKIHVSVLLDRAKIVVPKTTKIFGSGTRTGVTGLRRPVNYPAIKGLKHYTKQREATLSL